MGSESGISPEKRPGMYAKLDGTTRPAVALVARRERSISAIKDAATAGLSRAGRQPVPCHDTTFLNDTS